MHHILSLFLVTMVIPFALSSSSPALPESGKRAELCWKIVAACEDWGIVQAVDHVVDAELIVEMTRLGREFFMLPAEQKLWFDRFIVSNHLQIRLFISEEDAPSQSDLGAQDNLQAKASWLWHATGIGSDDSLPPGFEAPQTLYQFKKEIPQIPLIKWQCPPRFVLNTEWQEVAGEESEEVAIQNQRQLGVLEAIYPRPFTIPPNPSVSSEVQGSHHTDLVTPLIPITAIEDEDTSGPSDMEPPLDLPVQFQNRDANHTLTSLPYNR